MRKGIYIIVLALIVVTGMSMLRAGDESTPLPGTPADNECNPGGVLYREENQDGCPTIWYWKAGWFLARFNQGIISREDFPKEFGSVLPPLQPLPEAALLVPVCWPLQGRNSSIKYLGPPNTRANLIIYNSADCSGDSFITSDATSIVFANDLTGAEAICASFGDVILIRQLIDYGYTTAPANGYACLAA